MGSSTVSVVIPAYNPRTEWLAEAIESAVSQEPAPLEVLVVDDGSDAPVVHDHPLVRVVRQDNGGEAAARNRGIREARGDLIAFLDADDVWLPGKLAAQLRLMAGDVGLVSTGFDLLGPDGRRPGWGAGADGYVDLLAGNPIGASTVMVRRDVIREVGGFPEGLRRSPDWGAWLAVARVADLAHVDRKLVIYRVHEQAASSDYRAMWFGSMQVLWRHRRALPVRGVRRVGQIYGAQAFDAFRSTRRPTHLVWAFSLWPEYVIGEAFRQARRPARSLSEAGRPGRRRAR